MHYVYLLRSETHPDQIYFGCTHDLRGRLAQHNTGKSAYTGKFKPWRLISYIPFLQQEQAQRFEKYLKTGSGRAFAEKHLW